MNLSTRLIITKENGVLKRTKDNSKDKSKNNHKENSVKVLEGSSQSNEPLYRDQDTNLSNAKGTDQLIKNKKPLISRNKFQIRT